MRRACPRTWRTLSGVPRDRIRSPADRSEARIGRRLDQLAALMLLGALLVGAGQAPDFVTLMAVFVVTAGIVSRDASSGALQMILARPILRAEYLFGRYLAALVLVAAFLTAIFATAVLIDRAASLAGWNAVDQAFSWRDGLRLCAAELPEGGPGRGDPPVLLDVSARNGRRARVSPVRPGSEAPPQIAQLARKPVLARAGQVATRKRGPGWGLVRNRARGTPFQSATGQWALALAVVSPFGRARLFNRRELSYGQD